MRNTSPVRGAGVVASAAQLQAQLSNNRQMPEPAENRPPHTTYHPQQSAADAVKAMRASPLACMADRCSDALTHPWRSVHLPGAQRPPQQQLRQQLAAPSTQAYAGTTDAQSKAQSEQPVRVVPLQAPAMRKGHSGTAGRILYTDNARRCLRRSLVTHDPSSACGQNATTGAIPRGRQRWWRQQSSVSELTPNVTAMLPPKATHGSDKSSTQRRPDLPPLDNARMEAAQALALALRAPGAVPIDPAVFARARRQVPFSTGVRSSPPSPSLSTRDLDLDLECASGRDACASGRGRVHLRPRTAFDPSSTRSQHLQQYDAQRHAARVAGAPQRPAPQPRILFGGLQDRDGSMHATSDPDSSAQHDACPAASQRHRDMRTESASIAGELCAWAQHKCTAQPELAASVVAAGASQPRARSLVVRLGNFAPAISQREIRMSAEADKDKEPPLHHSVIVNAAEDTSELLVE